MPDDAYVELRDGYVYVHPPKGMPSWVSLHAVKSAVALCGEQQLFRVLGDIGDFAQQPPSTMDLFSLIVNISTVWDHRIKTAILDPSGWLKADRFAETVARNRGLEFSTFATEAEALNWLLA